jgi:hypothetical protein
MYLMVSLILSHACGIFVFVPSFIWFFKLLWMQNEIKKDCREQKIRILQEWSIWFKGLVEIFPYTRGNGRGEFRSGDVSSCTAQERLLQNTWTPSSLHIYIQKIWGIEH